MIYWILTDVAGEHGRRHDGDWEPLERRAPASDEVERFHRYRDAVAKAKKLKAKDCHCKPLKQEGIVLFWRLPAEVEPIAKTPAGKALMRWASASQTDLAEVIEFKSKRQADAWRKRAIAEGCEVIECLGTAKR
jgi:hypothetical protein